MSAPVPIAFDAERVADLSFAIDVETSSNALSIDAALLVVSFTSVAPEAGQVAQGAIDKAALLAATFEVSQEGKSQVSDWELVLFFVDCKDLV